MRTLNLGILAHVDAGKTTLTERLLFEAGVLEEPGSVDAGSTHTDTMALERRRGITIRAAVVSFEVDGTTVNLVDTPGHSDFIAEVERSLEPARRRRARRVGRRGRPGADARPDARPAAARHRHGRVRQQGRPRRRRPGASSSSRSANGSTPTCRSLFGSALQRRGRRRACCTPCPTCCRSGSRPADGPAGGRGLQDRPRRAPAARRSSRCCGPAPCGSATGSTSVTATGSGSPALRVFRDGGADAGDRGRGRPGRRAARCRRRRRIGDALRPRPRHATAEEFARPSLATVVEPVDDGRPAGAVRRARPARRAGPADRAAGGRRAPRAAALPVRRGPAAGDRLAARGGVRRRRCGSATRR